MAAATIAAGVTIGSSILGGVGRLRGNKQAEAAARQQADLVRQTTAEAARRMERGQERQLGEATAGVYASGIHMSGSSEAYVRDMQAEQARELQWLKDAGESRAQAIEDGAAVRRQTGRIGALAGIGRGVSRGIGML